MRGFTLRVFAPLIGLALVVACGSSSPGPGDLTGATLVFTQSPATNYEGEPLSPVTVEVHDSAGAVKTAVTGTVTLSVSGGSLQGTTSASLSAGKATFSGLHLDAPGTGLTLTATFSTLAAASSSPFDVKPVNLEFIGLPAFSSPDALPAIQVELVDENGAPLSSLQRTVSLNGSSPLAGTTQASTSGGVATFTGLSSGVANPLTLTASAPAAQSAQGSFVAAYSTTELEPADHSANTNDTQATAEPVQVGFPVFGTVATTGDVDFYKFHASAGQLLKVQSYATRLDQANWITGPQLELYGPDGSLLLRNDNNAIGWAAADYGFLQVPIPADGDYAVSINPVSFGGGKYALLVTLGDPIPNLQGESEALGQLGTNDTAATADLLNPGWLYAFHAYDSGSNTVDIDYYKVSVTGPARVQAQVISNRDGVWSTYGYSYDGNLVLYAADGTTGVASDDDAYFFDPAVDTLVHSSTDLYLAVGSGATSEAPYYLSYSVDPISPIAEVLPNDTAPNANAIAYGDIVDGTAPSTAAHLFKFTGHAGDMVRVHPYDSLDSDLAGRITISILGSDGATEVVEKTNGPNFRLTQAILPADGDYYVQVTPTAGGAWSFLLERVATNAMEVEPNDGPITAGSTPNATPFPADGHIAGAIDVAGDLDTFSFTAKEGQLTSIDLWGADGRNNGASSFAHFGSYIAPGLSIVDASGNVLSSVVIGSNSISSPESLDRPQATVSVAFDPPADGTYYVVVSDTQGLGGTNLNYALALYRGQ